MRTLLCMILAASLVLGGGMLMGPAESGEVEPPKIYLTGHGPIRINGDADFLTVAGVVNNATGDGSAGNPWIIENWEINGTGDGYCVYIGNTTEHFIVRNCRLHNASGGVGVYDFDTALLLHNVSRGALQNNTAMHSRFGIQLRSGSNNVSAERNAAVENTEHGICLDNNVADNDLNNNTAAHNGQVGIYAYLGTRNAIGYSNASFNGLHGIHFHSASDNMVFNCTIHNNTNVGASLIDGSGGNLITGSTFLGNAYGIRVHGSSGNRVFHNSFIGNSDQAFDGTGANQWDDGYPSGGNHWSDYNGTDTMSGPDQNIPGADGIGDTPYANIQGGAGAEDRYPFMSPYSGPIQTETVPPHALSWSPNGTGVSAHAPIAITWSEVMNWTSVEEAFEYTDGNSTWTTANGTWVHDPVGNVSTFTPSEPFLYETHYVATVNCSATDAVGNLLDQNLSGTGGEWPDDILQWSFTTDDEEPYVVSTQPADGQVDVDPFKPMKIVFSEPMNRTSTELAFSYTDGTETWNITNGSRHWNALRTELTFSPHAPLEVNTTYMVTLDGGLAKDTGGKGLKFGNHTWWFKTWLEPPAPKVLGTYPPDGASGVSVNTYINIIFDNEMDTQSAEDAFSYTDGTDTWTAADGTVDWYSDKTLFSFQPAQRLSFDSLFIVTVSADAKSAYGVNLDGNGNGIPDEDDDFIFRFATTPEPPTVVSHYPLTGQREVPTNLGAIYINFSKVMLINSVSNAVSISPVTAFTVTFQGGGQNLTLVMNEELRLATEYRVTVLGTAMDIDRIRLDGNGDGTPGDRFTFSFYTEGMETQEPLKITGVFPRFNSTIPVEGIYVEVVFNAVMNRTSVQGAFSFKNGTVEVNGTFSWSGSGRSFRFTPSSKLSYDTTYAVSVGGSAKDVDGRSLGNATSWQYMTESLVQEGSLLEWILIGAIIGLLALCVVLYMANRALRMNLKRTRVKLKRLKKQYKIADDEDVKFDVLEQKEAPAGEPAQEPQIPESDPGTVADE